MADQAHQRRASNIPARQLQACKAAMAERQATAVGRQEEAA